MIKRLGSNIYIGNRRKLDRMFNALAGRITWLGPSALNTSANTRQSVNPASIDRAVDAVDLWYRSGIPFISSLAAATNLVDTDLTNAVAWTIASSGTGATDPVITEIESGLYEVALSHTDAADVSVVRGVEPALAANNRTCSFQTLLMSGSYPTVESEIVWRQSTTKKGTPASLTDSSEWEDADATVASGDGNTDQVAFFFKGVTNAVFRVRNMRAVDSTAPAAPFPDGSAAGASVGVDAVNTSHTYGANTTFFISRKSYGSWIDSDNPVDAEPVIVEAGAMEIRVNASGFIETSGGAISTNKTDGNWQTIIVKVGGGNHSIQVDDETPVVAASAVVPSGDTYIANNTAGTKPDHSVVLVGLLSSLSTSAEDDAFEGIDNITNGQVFQ